MTSAVEDTIEFIASQLSTRSMAVWCGAGISLSAGLPLAYALMDHILAATSLDAAEQQQVRQFVHNHLPFERFMEIILESMDESVRTGFLNLFGLGAPAGCHHFLAALAKKKLVRAIYTTNFDTHIEGALKAAALTPGLDYEVSYQPERFQEIDWSRDTVRVIKLHGNVEAPLELGTTVARIATPAFRQYIESAIARVLQGDPAPSLLVLGYSFSDRFDISPVLSQCSKTERPATIVGVQHENTDILQAGPTIDAYDPRYAAPAKLLRDYPQHWLFGHTQSAIAAVCKRLGLNLETKSSDGAPPWMSYLGEFFKGVNERNGNMIGPSLAASLLSMIGADREAIKHLQERKSRAEAFGRDTARLVARQDLAGAYVRMHETGLAITELNDAVPIAEAIDNGKHADAVHSHLGALYMQIAEENIRKAHASYNKALAITEVDETSLRNISPIAGVAHCWMKLGDYDTAKKLYDAALQIVEPSGDVYRKAEVYGNIASWAYILRNYQMALDWYKKARDMSEIAGDIERVEIHRMNCANVYVKLGELGLAIKDFENAREVLGKMYSSDHPTLALLDRHLAYARHLETESKTAPEATPAPVH